MIMVSEDTPVTVEKFGNTYTKLVFVEEKTSNLSGKKYIYGERYTANSETGPWDRMSDWVWYIA